MSRVDAAAHAPENGCAFIAASATADPVAIAQETYSSVPA
jgi:hypothetical protein